MFGKIFEQTFTGSMCGKGAVVFAVWAYIIANTKQDHMVEVNPRIVAALLGCTEEDVVAAMKLHCSPDKASRSKDHRGCRLIKKGAYLYFVTGHERFRDCKNETARREYMRNYMRERRRSSTRKPKQS